MANALIQPYVQGVQAAATAPLYDPRFERSARRRFHRPLIPQLELANALYVSAGLWPARGWILVRRGDFNAFNLYATNLQLTIADAQTGLSLTFNNLAIVQSRCVSRGIAADADAVYLVELTDARGLVYNQWFQQSAFNWYNVRSPAYPQEYYTTSLNSGTPWTWDGMLNSLWNFLPLLGTYPGLPASVAPTATVEGFEFVGVSCWEAINQVLDLLGCQVAVDLTQASNPYTIVDLSQDDDAFTDLQEKYVGNLEDDLEWIDSGSGRVPAHVVVYFQRRNQYYGTEETIRQDSLQWSNVPAYSVTVNAPSQFSNAVGTHYLWCEFTVQYDVDSQPLAADVATAATVAAQRVAEYYDLLMAGTTGYMRQTYAGVLPFVTGSRCGGVWWHMDFRAQDYAREDDPILRMQSPPSRPEERQSGRLGWRTEIVFGPRPAWPEVELNAR